MLACGWFYWTAKTAYTEYRYFRALDVGTSDSSNLAPSANSEDATQIVLFGDSRIRLWNPSPEMDGIRFINAGVNGETTTEMRRRFDHDVLRHAPDAVIIQLGINDLTAVVTRNMHEADQFEERIQINTRFFLDQLEKNNIDAFVLSIFPHGPYSLKEKLFWDNTLQQKVAHTNQMLESIANEFNAVWLDVTNMFLEADGSVKTDLYNDSMHITSDAYTALNKQLLTTLSQLKN